jgi:hypothetical protein
MNNETLAHTIKRKLIDVSIPATVGVIMLFATYHIIAKVMAEISNIAEDAASRAVEKAPAKIDPAIEWLSAKAITPEVRVGGVLEVEYSAVIRRQCPADLRAFLLDEDLDTAAYRFPDQAGGYRQASPRPQTFRIKVNIVDPPSGSGFPPLVPGNYKYRATAIRYCDRIELDSQIPDATFRIVR